MPIPCSMSRPRSGIIRWKRNRPRYHSGCCAWLFGLTVAHVTAYGSLAFVVQSIAHADLRLPRQTMRSAGLVFVTPELHALHHSRHPAETNSNYGQCLASGTRCSAPCGQTPTEPISVGLEAYASARFRGLLGALTQPSDGPTPRAGRLSRPGAEAAWHPATAVPGAPALGGTVTGQS